MPSPPAFLSNQAAYSPHTLPWFYRRQSLHPSIILRFGTGFIFSTVDTVDGEERFKSGFSDLLEREAAITGGGASRGTRLLSPRRAKRRSLRRRRGRGPGSEPRPPQSKRS